MMPPPMMTIWAWVGRAWVGKAMVSSGVLQGGEGALEARQIVGGVGGVIKIDGGMGFRDHAPHGLAQQGSAFHGAIAPFKIGGQGLAEIFLQQPALIIRLDL